MYGTANSIIQQINDVLNTTYNIIVTIVQFSLNTIIGIAEYLAVIVPQIVESIGSFVFEQYQLMLSIGDAIFTHLLWEADKLEAFLASLGLEEVAPIFIQIFYALANLVNIGLLRVSIALSLQSPKLGTTLFLFLAGIQKILISSYGLLSI